MSDLYQRRTLTTGSGWRGVRLALAGLCVLAMGQEMAPGLKAPDHPPIEAPPPPQANDLNKDLLKHVEDGEPIRSEQENPDEARAYDYIVRFASRVPPHSFEKFARQDLTIGHLLGPECWNYRGEVARVSGNLKRVRDLGPTAALAADGVNHLYEGWIFSPTYRNHSFCVLFTEKPIDLVLADSMDRPATFEGYFFKKYKFPSLDGKTRVAPLLIGRTIRLSPEKPAVTVNYVWNIPSRIIPATVGAILAFGLVLLGLHWWMRRDDERTRQRLNASRSRPFDIGDLPPRDLN